MVIVACRHGRGSAHENSHVVAAAFAVAAPVEGERVAARVGRELDIAIGPGVTGSGVAIAVRVYDFSGLRCLRLVSATNQ